MFDTRDKHGDDVSLLITVKLDSERRYLTGRVILDAKSSPTATETFNKDIHLFRKQKKARVKKAVWANPAKRTKHDLASELLELLTQVGLCPLEQAQRERVLNWLSQR